MVISDLRLRVELLERQVAALYSVLSEWDQDKSVYTQWHKAEAIEQLLNHLTYNESVNYGVLKENQNE